MQGNGRTSTIQAEDNSKHKGCGRAFIVWFGGGAEREAGVDEIEGIMEWGTDTTGL